MAKRKKVFRVGDCVLMPQITREGVRLPRWTGGKIRSVESGRAAVLTRHGLVISDVDVLEPAGEIAEAIEMSLMGTMGDEARAG